MPEQFPERDPIEEITDRLGEVDWLHGIRRGAIWAGRGNIAYLWGCIVTDAVTNYDVPTEAYAVGGGLSVLTCGTYFAVDALQRRQERQR